MRLISVGVDSTLRYSITYPHFSPTPRAYVQPGGKRVCVLEWPENRAGHRRIAMIDGETGKPVGHLRGLGIRPVGWTEDGREFLAISYQARFLASLDLFSSRSLWIISMDDRGRTRERNSLGSREVGFAKPVPGSNKHLLSTVGDGIGTLVVLDPDRAEISEVAAASSSRRQRVWRTPEGFLVRFEGPAEDYSAWLVGDDPYHPAPVTVAKGPGRDGPSKVVNEVLQSVLGDGVIALLDRLSRPGEGHPQDDGRVRGIYSLPTLVRDDTPVYYVETWIDERSAKLFVRRPSDDGWTRIGGQIPVGTPYLESVRSIPEGNSIETDAIGALETLSIDEIDGVVAFISEERGHFLVNLYDARRNRTFEATDLGPTGQGRLPFIRLDRIQGMDGLFVDVWYDGPRWIRYDPASGDLELLHPPAVSKKRVKAGSGDSASSRTAWVYRAASLIYRDSKGTEIHYQEPELVRLTPDGQRVVLWSE